MAKRSCCLGTLKQHFREYGFPSSNPLPSNCWILNNIHYTPPWFTINPVKSYLNHYPLVIYWKWHIEIVDVPSLNPIERWWLSSSQTLRWPVNDLGPPWPASALRSAWPERPAVPGQRPAVPTRCGQRRRSFHHPKPGQGLVKKKRVAYLR